MNPYSVITRRVSRLSSRSTLARWRVTLRRNGTVIERRTHVLRWRARRTAAAWGAQYGTVPR